jgi:hypothetical protein
LISSSAGNAQPARNQSGTTGPSLDKKRTIGPNFANV